jgi:hypothetical protein
MQQSIRNLLSGINTAFNTSIVGVVLSIVFNFLFLQPLLKRLEQDCNALADRLDQTYFIDTVDHLKELIGFETDGEMWYPKDVNRQMLKELSNQTVSLSNFTTDLSDSMQNLAGSLVSSYRDEMKLMITQDLQPTLSRLATSADKLQEDKSQSTDQALEGIIDRLDSILTDFLRDFRENVAGQTKSELAGLAIQLKTAGDSIGSLPMMLEGLRNTFTSMTEQSVRALNNASLQGSSLQSESLSELRKMADQVKISMESFSRSLAAAETQNKHAEIIVKNLKGVADATGSSVSDLASFFKDFKSQNEVLMQSMGKEAEALRKEVASVQSASQGFIGLDVSLTKTFEVVKGGLTEYRELTRLSLEKYLSNYSDSFKQFSDRLAGAVEQLGELVEDLQASVDGMKRP